MPAGVRQTVRAPSPSSRAVHRALTLPSHLRFSMTTSVTTPRIVMDATRNVEPGPG